MDGIITDGMINLAILAVGAFATGTIGFGIAWIRARERAIVAEQSGGRLDAAGIEARFDRIDQAMESIAIEIERVAEAERFQSKLMASRIGVLPERASGRVITPH